MADAPVPYAPSPKAKGMVFPRHVLVGHGVLDEAGALARALGLQGPAAIVSGPTTRRVAGEHVADVLGKEGFATALVEAGGATRAEVTRVAAAAREVKARFVVGVGGGSVIDVAKLAATELGAPMVSVPTSAAHDGITSPRASMKEGRGSASVEAVTPIGILADTSVIVQAPFRLLAAGCADCVSNLSAVEDWALAHRLRGEEYSSFAAVLARTAADMVMENAHLIRPGLEEAAWLAVKSLIVSGVSMSVAGSSRPASGAEHMFSHALDRIAPAQALHGEQVGLGAILMLHLHKGPWERARDALAEIGAPTTAAAAGLTRRQVVQALGEAHRVRPDRFTILGTTGIAPEAAERLVEVTGVA